MEGLWLCNGGMRWDCWSVLVAGLVDRLLDVFVAWWTGCWHFCWMFLLDVFVEARSGKSALWVEFQLPGEVVTV